MEKENGETGGGDGGGRESKGSDASSLLDAASLFGAYWGRDPSALLGGAYGGAGGGGFSMLGGGGGGGGGGQGGGGGGRYPPTSTLSVAASQAASLGLHPAASAAWWSMASQLAAQDYLARLQASGLGGFPPGGDPYSLAAGLAAAQQQQQQQQRQGGARGRPAGQRAQQHRQQQVKEKDKNMRSSYGMPKTSSPSMSSSLGMPAGLSSMGLSSMAGSRTPTLSSASPQPLLSSSSSSGKHSRKSSSSAAAKASALSGAYLGNVSSKGGSPSPSSAAAAKEKEQLMMRGDLLMAQAYQQAVQGKNSSSLFGNPFGLSSMNASGLSEKDRHSGLDSLANLPHTILSDGASILGGVRLPPDTEIIKYTSSIVGPKVPGTTNRGRKKTISLDPPHVSVLPSLSSTGLLVERGGPAKRPKLDSEYGHLQMAHQNSSTTSLAHGGPAQASASGSDRVEVIKLPSGASDPRSSTPFSMSGYTGLSKELLQSIANQSGLNLAALEKQFAEQFGGSSNYRAGSTFGSYGSSNSTAQDMGLNLSSKPGTAPSQPQRDESPASTANDDDAPLNLSLKPASVSRSSDHDWKASIGATSSSRAQDEAASSLSSLSSITASLGARTQPPPPSRVSRRKPGAKPRRVIQESSPSPSQPPGQESPTPSGSEDSDMGPWHSTKEGRPRNLGRGVSKPKKNTVASLLAQSRALGIRPALAHQYLQEAADLLNPELQEKLKAAMGDMAAGLGGGPPELSGTDSEGPPSDSCAEDSDASDALAAEPMLRLPLAMGWRRETLMKGLSRNGSIKGDVTYSPPEPHSNIKLKSMQELSNYLEKSPCPPLQKENFSFSSRPLIGRFLQVGGQEGMSETEVAKRLEEARRALGTASGAASLAVEQRIELARQQQAAREARKDAAKGREQARLAREQERSERAEQARRDKEARSLQLMEAQMRRADENLKILNANDKTTIGFWKSIRAIASSSAPGKQISVSMPSMSLTLTPVPSVSISPVTLSPVASAPQWKEEYEYNALDKIKSFAESASMSFSPTKSKPETKKDFKLIPVKHDVKSKSNAVSVIKLNSNTVKKEDFMDKILDTYSRMGEFVSGQCDWAKATPNKSEVKSSKLDDLKVLEEKYLNAKKDFMSSNLMLMPNLDSPKKTALEEAKAESIEVIDLVDNDEDLPTEKQSMKAIGEDLMPARRKRQEDLEKQRQEDQSRKQQERELKRQQAVMLKEQLYMAEVGKQRELIYTVELERERRRQHMALVKQLDGRRRYEERERRKHRLLLDKLTLKERKLEQRKRELELLKELRKPQEDSTLSDQKPLPTFNRIPGLKLPGQAMADILMVFEFINNFGLTLGFDMETLPTLNTLQMALLPDCCTDAEEELLSILTHLLVCAIEDPGIPHPGRHTTILGHTLRTNEITPANVSEVLRIYLYANATGEIKSLTGINPERDREKRIADHHQNDSEVLEQSCHGRNAAYYLQLHRNPTWRLAERLRQRPYLALNPTSKARILALLCDELLQSKAVLRQIDASLESLGQMKKERYLMDAKLRKLKMMHSRKLRIENAEKQQALALERMQRMVEESEMAAVSAANSILNTPPLHDSMDASIDANTPAGDKSVNSLSDCEHKTDMDGKDDAMNNSVVNHAIDETPEVLDSALMGAPPALYLKEVAKEVKDLEITKANGTKDILDKEGSVMGDGDMMLSDVESEGTQPEEDEDKNLPAEELARKLDKLIRQSDAQLQSLAAGAHSLRATCYGQDRYWRRYWSLGKCGGVYVEAMESAQPEIMGYHERVEEGSRRREEEEAASKAAGRRGTRTKRAPRAKACSSESQEAAEARSSEQLLQNELELRSIKSELNLGDHTRIIKYEPNMGHSKVQGSPIKMEEKHIQQQKVAEDHLLDIEDSIPTAFLVQKPQSGKNIYGVIIDGDKSDVKYETAEVKTEQSIKMESGDSSNTILDLGIKQESKDGIVTNNLEELKKLADSVVMPKENSDSEVKLEANILEKVKEEKVEVKDETNDPEAAANMLTTKMTEGRWFSILRKENPLADSSQCTQANGIEFDKDGYKNTSLDSVLSQINGNINSLHANPVFSENTQTCSEIILTQGNRWDVCNNLHLLSNPSLLFNTNGNQVQAPTVNNFYHADCTLTMSGLDEDMLNDSLNPKQDSSLNDSGEQLNLENGTKDESMNHVDALVEQIVNNVENINDVSLDKSPSKKTKPSSSVGSSINGGNASGTASTVSTANNNCTLGITGLNLSALTSYVSCESPAPLQMTQEESEQLEYCKINGLPKKLDGNYVPKDLRHGWWKITDTDQLKETLAKLHPRGVRERELHNSFLMGLVQTNNKLTIEKGDLLATELSISHLDRVIALNGGFPSPDSSTSFSVKTARRIDLALLEQVEALEERVAAASMQVKGWKPPPRAGPPGTPPRCEDSGGAGPARARLLALEAAIERRYLRPPLGAGAPTPALPPAEPPPQGQEEEQEPHNQDSRGSVLPRGLATWREGTARCQTSAQLAMVLHALEAAIAWDKSIMKANCQFCQSGDSEDKLLLCDGCDKGYHTYCFKPKMEKIPDGDWYCFECLNKATGDRVCIVCGGKGGTGGVRGGRLVPCALCPRAYHQDCHYPPLSKVPRGKWYCVKCVSRAPPKKPRSAKKPKLQSTGDSLSDTMQPPSPAPSQASTTTTIEDCPITSAMLNQSSLSSVQSTPEKHFQQSTTPSDGKQHFAGINNMAINSINDSQTTPVKNSDIQNDSMDYIENDKDKMFYNVDESNLNLEDSKNDTNMDSCYNDFKELEDFSDADMTMNSAQDKPLRQSKAGSNSEDGEASCGTVENDSNSGHNSEDYKGLGNEQPSSPRDREGRHSAKKDRGSHKRLNKELAHCKALLEEMEIHDDSWPFLLPVNTKQFPTYKKVIRTPMDLSTIKRKLQDNSYKTKEEFASDVRQIFHNCEVFNEDESPVGRAGHGMRRFFEERWSSV